VVEESGEQWGALLWCTAAVRHDSPYRAVAAELGGGGERVGTVGLEEVVAAVDSVGGVSINHPYWQTR
jgi:hypothetical protein